MRHVRSWIELPPLHDHETGWLGFQGKRDVLGSEARHRGCDRACDARGRVRAQRNAGGGGQHADSFGIDIGHVQSPVGAKKSAKAGPSLLPWRRFWPPFEFAAKPMMKGMTEGHSSIRRCADGLRSTHMADRAR